MRPDLRSATPTEDPRFGTACLGILTLSLILRLAFLNQFQSSPLFTSPVGPDVSEYWAWSGAILQGKWLWDSVPLHGPLYAFVLAAERWITHDSFFALRLFQLLIGLAAQVLVGWAVWRQFGGRIALAALTLWTLHVPLLFYEGQFYAEGLLTLLLSGVLALTIGCKSAPTPRRAGVIGVLLGLAAITHPRSLLFAFGILVWLALAIFRRQSTPTAVPHPKKQNPPSERIAAPPGSAGPRWFVLALATAGLLLPTVPISIYNSRLAGSFTLVQRHEGLNLFIGNNPSADGTPNVRVGPQWDRLVSRPRLEGGATTDAASRAWYQARVWEFVTCAPLPWLALETRKFALTFAAREITASAPYDTLAADIPLLRVPLLGFGLLLPLALFGLIRGGWRVFPTIWLVVATVISSLIFVAAGRYRLEMLPPLFLLGGLGAVHIFDLLRDSALRKKWTAWLPAASAFIVGVVFANLPLQFDRRADQAEGAFLRGMAWLLKQDRPHAEAEFRRAVAIQPDFVNAIQVLGEVVEDSGRADEGLALIRRSVELDDHWPRSLDRLSAMLGRRGDREGMYRYAQAALAIDPQTGGARLRLAMALTDDGKFDAAIEHFQTLLVQAPQAEVFLQFSTCLRQAGRYTDLAALLRRGVSRFPTNDQLALRLARVLAACPDENVRQPAQALEIAQKAVALNTERRAEAFDVLGMALAANGKFDEAVAAASKSFAAAKSVQLQGLIQERIALYHAGRPFVDAVH